MNYSETCSPIVRNSSLIFLLGLVVELDLGTDHLDLTVIFLNEDLEDVCMHQPQWFIKE
jgi:hypothetical protein